MESAVAICGGGDWDLAASLRFLLLAALTADPGVWRMVGARLRVEVGGEPVGLYWVPTSAVVGAAVAADAGGPASTKRSFGCLEVGPAVVTLVGD